MTAKKFLVFSFLQFVSATLLKIWFFNYQIFFNPGVEAMAYWLATAVIAAAMVRRLGVINYLEAIFIMVIWTAGGAFIDLIFTSVFTGLDIFFNIVYWAGLLVMNVVIFLFHKKRHVQVRHELRAKAHGHKH